MLEFLETCLSFPVNIFSGLLIIACLYWLVAALGLVDIDSLDMDMDGDLDLGGDLDPGGDLDAGEAGGDAGFDDLDVSGGAKSLSGLGAFSSLLFQLGLYGVPMTLIITFIALFGWFISYYIFHWFLGAILPPGLIRYALGALVLLASLLTGAFLTAQVIKPLRRFFKKEKQITGASLRGRAVVIRSSQVTAAYGEAECRNAGSTLLLDVRPAREGAVFKRGDKVVLLDYDPDRRLYTIISEDEFRGR
ncbi:YqiJ family protein [Deltaproteobacteria bacterium OttesenSCG-928-M10]|nr:YqiJ family protein [Deltaproteobacteria bacterium OttesenSCG-928-M10]